MLDKDGTGVIVVREDPCSPKEWSWNASYKFDSVAWGLADTKAEAQELGRKALAQWMLKETDD